MKNKTFVMFLMILCLLRLVNLSGIPIYTDEALYISIADDIVRQPMVHGLDSIKFAAMPLYTWFLAVFSWFKPAGDSIWWGRFYSVMLDTIAAYVVFMIGNKIFDRRVGQMAAVTYMVLPLTWFFSRLAMVEPLINLLGLLIVYQLIVVLEDKGWKSWWRPVLLGVLAFFTKALVLTLMPALVGISGYYWWKNKDKPTGQTIIKKLILIAVSVGGVIGWLYLPVAFQFERFVSLDNFMWWQHAYLNLRRGLVWIGVYVTWPAVIILIWGGWVAMTKRKWWPIWAIGSAGGVWVVGSLIAANYFPRHLYLIAGPLSLALGWALMVIKKRNGILILVMFLILLSIKPAKLAVALMADPVKAQISLEDRQILYEDWTSAYGFDKVAQKMSSLAVDEELTLIIDGDQGVVWLWGEYYGLGNHELVGREGPVREDELLRLVQSYDNQERTYLIMNQYRGLDYAWLQLVHTKNKLGRGEIEVYKFVRRADE